MSKKVPLVVHENGERKVVGVATINEDGTIEGEINANHNSEILKDITGVKPGEYSIGFGES